MDNLEELEETFNQDKGLYIAIKRAMNDLYRYDKHLIFNAPYKKECPDELGKHYVGERAIVFRFAHYLQNELVKDPIYKTYDLDCEYNRNHGNVKALPSYPNGVFPDLIIHKRNSNKKNLLVIEFKTYWNNSIKVIESDIKKVSELMKKPYYYNYGLVVIIGKTTKDTKIINVNKEKEKDKQNEK
ncbi:MAG: hypothetical protein J6K17_04350 [Oscillospiraceae bacterium]|nr:hypothetical protein [Oscillospiraceae bacterium]